MSMTTVCGGHLGNPVELSKQNSGLLKRVAELKAENSKLKKVLTRVENAVSVVMSCNWKDCACRHGTEYGDDVEFDYLCSVISKCQDQMKEEDNVMDKVRVVAGVRYCEDASVNGVDEKEDFPTMPFMDKSPYEWFEWEFDITIDVNTGHIENWPSGVTAKTWYKVSDCCKILVDGFKEYDDYVPEFLSIYANGCGDYIFIEIDGDGIIKDWNPDKCREFIENNLEEE